jgi:hypothetical protein
MSLGEASEPAKRHGRPLRVFVFQKAFVARARHRAPAGMDWSILLRFPKGSTVTTVEMGARAPVLGIPEIDDITLSDLEHADIVYDFTTTMERKAISRYVESNNAHADLVIAELPATAISEPGSVVDDYAMNAFDRLCAPVLTAAVGSVEGVLPGAPREWRDAGPFDRTNRNSGLTPTSRFRKEALPFLSYLRAWESVGTGSMPSPVTFLAQTLAAGYSSGDLGDWIAKHVKSVNLLHSLCFAGLATRDGRILRAGKELLDKLPGDFSAVSDFERFSRWRSSPISEVSAEIDDWIGGLEEQLPTREAFPEPTVRIAPGHMSIGVDFA